MSTALAPPKPAATVVATPPAEGPQRSWPSIARESIEAAAAAKKGDMGPMQLFVNETRGETWELVGDRSDDHALQARAKAEGLPIGTVPVGGLVLTAGVDVQRDRWEIGVWAWGRGLESWTVDHAVIEGNPSSEEDWKRVTEYLQRRYPQAWHGGTVLAKPDSDTMATRVLSLFNGRNAREVARKLGIGRASVYRYLKQAGGRKD